MADFTTYTPEQASSDLKRMADICAEKSLSIGLFDISAAVLDSIDREGGFGNLIEYYVGSVVQIAKDVLLIIKDKEN
jgi:hypothetical protein